MHFKQFAVVSKEAKPKAAKQAPATYATYGLCVIEGILDGRVSLRALVKPARVYED